MVYVYADKEGGINIDDCVLISRALEEKLDAEDFISDAYILDVSVSYMAEVERGRTGISVKMLIKICDVLGLSADYVLFGEQRGQDAERLDRLNRIDGRYLPLLDSVIAELLALSGRE